jgi:hypothetical protein
MNTCVLSALAGNRRAAVFWKHSGSLFFRSRRRSKSWPWILCGHELEYSILNNEGDRYVCVCVCVCVCVNAVKQQTSNYIDKK